MTDQSNDPSVNLIRAVTQNLQIEDAAWTKLSVVFGIRPNFTPDSAYGYAFDGDEGRPIALSVDLIALKQPVQEYLQSVYKAGQKAPVKILVQFNDETGEYNIDFEDQDVDRWKVSPRNLDLIREELRPGF